MRLPSIYLAGDILLLVKMAEACLQNLRHIVLYIVHPPNNPSSYLIPAAIIPCCKVARSMLLITAFRSVSETFRYEVFMAHTEVN
jgi:hypothetical protein